MKNCLENCAIGDIILYSSDSSQYKPRKYIVKEPMNEYGGVLTVCLNSGGDTMFVQPHLDGGFIRKIIKLLPPK